MAQQGSLHAYFTYLTGGMLYRDYAHMEDPNVSWQAYRLVLPICPWQPTSRKSHGRNPDSLFRRRPRWRIE